MADSPIERVDVVVSESDPTAYILQVVSRLPKGSSCSWFNGYDVARPYAGVIDVTVTHFEVTEMMPCTADLPVVSTEIPLGTDFAPNQAYRVTVNGAAITSFTARDLEGPEAVIADSPVEHFVEKAVARVLVVLAVPGETPRAEEVVVERGDPLDRRRGGPDERGRVGGQHFELLEIHRDVEAFVLFGSHPERRFRQIDLLVGPLRQGGEALAGVLHPEVRPSTFGRAARCWRARRRACSRAP